MLSLNLGKYKRNQDLNKIRQFCSRTANATSSISFKESRSRAYVEAPAITEPTNGI